jgi:hypothetical protein
MTLGSCTFQQPFTRFIELWRIIGAIKVRDSGGDVEEGTLAVHRAKDKIQK